MALNNRKYWNFNTLEEQNVLKFGARKSAKKSRRPRKSAKKSHRAHKSAKKSRRSRSKRTAKKSVKKSAKKSRSKSHSGKHHEFRRLVLA